MKTKKLHFVVFLTTFLLFFFELIKSEEQKEFLEFYGKPNYNNEEISIQEEASIKLLSEELVIIEIDFFLVGLNNLIGTRFWFDLHEMNSHEQIVLAIITYLNCIHNPNHMIHKNRIVRHYINNQVSIKREVLSDYNGYRELLEAMVTKFVRNTSKFNCYRMKTVLAMIYLIFNGDYKHTISGFLLFLLICSYKELVFSSFSLSFIKVMKNEHNLGSILIYLGGNDISELLNKIKAVSYQYSNVKYPVSPETQNIKNPIYTEMISVEELGFKFCLSILELAANGAGISDYKLLTLFFGSRMDTAAEVLLSIDILKVAGRFGSSITECISLLINDPNVFYSVKSKIMTLYGLDISNFKSKFNDCVLLKDKYTVLNGIVNYTDYQRKAKTRSKSRSRETKISLRSKYSFL
ncbi:uncharacterized protein cubi_01694 [Cryptosporidium ubiquitum]|uniref:Uncharacterized protein n=1 Tax=Cryptosporidium ubiquitum TaxID=857276 RepID=A0A1J4MET9_9CRYT|nr:uncharacterized protein cubi_01694 [Cryptosporidium ubiquitum]OII72744.1 hypothetical protein cubi_01694 [Cryptosporidium ubiquitum]